MKKVESLTGKNLPRLAVAKPGWPPSMRPDTGDEPRLGIPEQAWRPSEKAVADFTRVCDQTGLSENLRKD